MQEELLKMKKELADILAANKQLKQALREVNKLDMIKASLIVRNPKHQSLKIDRILDGDLPTDVAVGDFVFIENYCELVKSAYSNLNMGNSMNAGLLKAAYRILEEDPDADFRTDSPVVFAFSHVPPDWQDIDERLTNSFRRIYAGRIENDIAARAMYIHNCVIDIWPFDEYNGELAIFAMNYYLMEQMKKHFADGGTVAAICAAPGLVASQLPDIEGKKVTCYDGFEEALMNEGAEYTGEPTETDGNLITGRGPGCAVRFAVEIVRKLKGDEVAEKVFAGLLA